MRTLPKLALSLFASLVAIIATEIGPPAACAQDVTTPSGYQFFVTPYLWLASVHATTSTPLEHEPQVNSNVSTIDLLSHFDGAPFMGSFEARYGNLGFLTDAIHLPVSTKIRYLGKIQRISSKRGLVARRSAGKRTTNQWVTTEFPTLSSRELIGA